MESIDLIIIGAGPAGLSTALHLLQIDSAWGERMLILEKKAHPRHKLCAGGVTNFGSNILSDLGFPYPLPLSHALVDDAQLIYERRVLHFRGEPEFVVYQREQFDAWLAVETQSRGGTLIENTPVQSISIEEEGVQIITPESTYHAQAIVGADGTNGITQRIVNPGGKGKQIARSLEVIIPAPGATPSFTEGFAQFDFTPVKAALQGYIWNFPARVFGEPYFNRGIYDARLFQRRARPKLPRLIKKSLATWGNYPDVVTLQGHPIHWFSPKTQISSPRVLLAGDSAGVDSLFGEGIGPALGYGKIAAQTINDGFLKGDLSFRDYRKRVIYSSLGYYLLLRKAIAWIGYRMSTKPWFMHLVWTIGRFYTRLIK